MPTSTASLCLTCSTTGLGSSSPVDTSDRSAWNPPEVAVTCTYAPSAVSTTTYARSPAARRSAVGGLKGDHLREATGQAGTVDGRDGRPVAASALALAAAPNLTSVSRSTGGSYIQCGFGGWASKAPGPDRAYSESEIDSGGGTSQSPSPSVSVSVLVPSACNLSMLLPPPAAIAAPADPDFDPSCAAIALAFLKQPNTSSVLVHVLMLSVDPESWEALSPFNAAFSFSFSPYLSLSRP